MLAATQSAQIETIVRRVMRDDHVEALSIGIARNGRRLYLRGFGERDVESGQAADGYTIYRAGSITKQFAAAAVMLQVQRSAVALDAAIGTYLPSLPPPAAPVTIAQLLSQTSGISSDAVAGATFSSALAAPLEFPAGTSWSYSNTNYGLLGAILEAQRNQPFCAIVRDEITQPLDLLSTACGFPAYARNVAHGYRYDGAQNVPYDNAARTLAEGAATALTTNVPDLLLWLDALYSGRVLSPASFAAMTRDTRLPDGTMTHYGYGFFIRNWYGWRVAEHAGHVDGYSSDDALVLDDGLAVAVLSNADRVDLVPFTQAIVAVVERPKDTNLVANQRPPDNEDLYITGTVRAILSELQRGTLDTTLLSSRFAASLTSTQLDADERIVQGLGEPRLVEFTERTHTGAMQYDRYRVTFPAQTLWVTAGYGADQKIDAFSLEPDTD